MTYEVVQQAARSLSLPVSHYLAEFGGGRVAAMRVIAAVETGTALPLRRQRIG